MKQEVTRIGDVVAWLDATFHPELQEDYDNAGFLLGDSHAEYRGALVALDLTPAVVDEAVKQELNLIVTHHPFIFRGLKRITDRSEAGRMTMALITNGIAVYAAHTNLDNLPWGVSGILAKKLNMKNCSVLHPLATSNGKSPAGAGMVGELPRMVSSTHFLVKIKRLLKQPTLRTSPFDPEMRIHRIALCGGSGAPFIDDAIAAGADIFITADLKYHDFQRAEGRIILVDAGHYETEQFAKEIISRAISEKFSNFACRISENQASLIQYM